MISGIYSITNIINKKIYIGSSKNIDKRIRKHFGDLRNNKHANSHLQNAYNKYGRNSFSWEIVKGEIPFNELERIEQEFIDSIPQDLRYNQRLIANNNGGIKLQQATKDKMSAAMKGEGNNFHGKKHTDESKDLMRAAKLGKKQNEAAIIKRTSMAIGKHKTESARKNISIGQPNRCTVEIDSIIYNSYSEAGKFFGVTHQCIKNRVYSDKFPNYKLVTKRA